MRAAAWTARAAARVDRSIRACILVLALDSFSDSLRSLTSTCFAASPRPPFLSDLVQRLDLSLTSRSIVLDLRVLLCRLRVPPPSLLTIPRLAAAHQAPRMASSFIEKLARTRRSARPKSICCASVLVKELHRIVSTGLLAGPLRSAPLWSAPAEGDNNLRPHKACQDRTITGAGSPMREDVGGLSDGAGVRRRRRYLFLDPLAAAQTFFRHLQPIRSRSLARIERGPADIVYQDLQCSECRSCQLPGDIAGFRFKTKIIGEPRFALTLPAPRSRAQYIIHTDGTDQVFPIAGASKSTV